MSYETNAPPCPQEWKFSQVFGDKSPIDEVTDVDIVSSIEFDDTGDFIAAGDRGGRVVIFERNKKKTPLPEYKFYCEFQSHEPEFDYLKSLEIEEKINKIKWCKRQNNSHLLLTTNDKTIKLWKVYEKKLKQLAVQTPKQAHQQPQAPGSPAGPAHLPHHGQQGHNHGQAHNGHALPHSGHTLGASPLHVPVLQTRETIVSAAPRRIFANAHAYHINSISLNSDGETYISSDDLRINLWNLNIVDQSFNIVDIKPANMEELTEVITSAEFHPQQCNIFMYSSSKGTIKLGDMRDAALCDQHAKVFEEEEDPSNKSFFSEIISSISDIKFTRDGRYIVARDYLTLKVWDVHMEAKPVRVIPIHDHLRAKLCDLYENDCIFDKFECALAGDGSFFVSGSYHNYFHVLDPRGGQNQSIEASKFGPKQKRLSVGGPAAGKQPAAKGATGAATTGSRSSLPGGGARPPMPDTIDFSKKTLHVSVHPREPVVAVAASNNLFIYSA